MDFSNTEKTSKIVCWLYQYREVKADMNEFNNNLE